MSDKGACPVASVQRLTTAASDLAAVHVLACLNAAVGFLTGPMIGSSVRRRLDHGIATAQARRVEFVRPPDGRQSIGPPAISHARDIKDSMCLDTEASQTISVFATKLVG